MVVVPIPYASDWLTRTIVCPDDDDQQEEGSSSTMINNNNKNTSTTTTTSPKSVVESQQEEESRKRGREEDDNNDGDDDMVMTEDATKQSKTTATTTTVSSSSSSSMDCGGDDHDEHQQRQQQRQVVDQNDWWPAGTCKSHHDQIPILAKVSYDHLHCQPNDQAREDAEDDNGLEKKSPQKGGGTRRLMLNDIVSIIGVLSINPWEADFSNQIIADDDGWGYGSSTSSLGPTLPPPSRLPRLHVLSYQKLNLDDSTVRAASASASAVSKSSLSETTKEVIMETDDVTATTLPYVPSLLSSQLNGFTNHDVLTQSLWMCLLSKGERRKNDNGHYELLRAGPMERTLGCLSVQLSTPDLASSRALFNRLGNSILPEICPVVATIDLSPKTGDYDDSSVTAPCKDTNGRLKPSPLQLPSGSVLLVHYPGNNTISSSFQAAMHEMVQHHRLPYRFEGGVILPFEADYRIIVVTTQTQQLPCTISVLTKLNGMTEESQSTNTISNDSACFLRETMARVRANINRDGSKYSFTLSPSLLERAQQDFLDRRQCAYESKNDETAASNKSTLSSSPSSLPGEDDFHRWLNLTRLQAKSRLSRKIHQISMNSEDDDMMKDDHQGNQWEANVEDWEIALQLDDVILQGYH